MSNIGPKNIERKVCIKVTDYFGNYGKGLKRLDDLRSVEYETFPDETPEITAELINNFDMVVSTYSRWTERSIKGNDRLVAVVSIPTGYDHIDVPALTKAGIMICKTTKSVSRPMATCVLTFMLCLGTRIFEKDRLLRQGHWTLHKSSIGNGFWGKTLGGIGVGNIGHEVFKMAQSLDMKHIAYDPYVKPETVSDVDVTLVDLDTVLSKSDYLFIALPLSDETNGLLGENELAKMKETAFLINISRGKIINERALIKALQAGEIKGAGLDVFEHEPIQKGNPLLNMDNVIVTPHNLGEMTEYYTLNLEEKIQQISQIIKGEIPEFIVNPEVLNLDAYKKRVKRFRHWG